MSQMVSHLNQITVFQFYEALYTVASPLPRQVMNTVQACRAGKAVQSLGHFSLRVNTYIAVQKFSSHMVEKPLVVFVLQVRCMLPYISLKSQSFSINYLVSPF